MSPRTTRLAFLSLVSASVAAGMVAGSDHGWSRFFGSRPAAAQDSSSAAAPPGPEFATNVCIGCHSPTGGPPLSGRLTGRWLSPNITPDPVSGIGAWSRDDLFRYLRNGRAPGRGQAGGPMAAIVENLQDNPDADIESLVEWLSSRPGYRDPADEVPASERGERLTVDPSLIRDASAPASNTAQLGAALYNSSCASCHGVDGAGSRGGHYPSMLRNSSVGRPTPHNLVAALLEGIDRHVRDDVAFMQSFDGRQPISGGLSNEELAALSNFVLEQFGDPSAATITPEWIARSRLAWWGSGEPTAARGEQIAVGGGPGGAGAACFNCHGLQGQGDAGSGSPRLAGLDVTYFAKQMRDYRSGSRPHAAMTAIAQQLGEADAHALSLYYAGLSAEATIPTARPDPSLLQAGEALYLRGAPERGIQACAACHGVAGGGLNPVYPSVLQPASYTAEQLRLWRDGTRRNDPHDLMGAASRSLTDEDIRGVSAYAAELNR